jgi:hypothetical protein
MGAWTDTLNVLDQAAWAACTAKAGPLCGSAPTPATCGSGSDTETSTPGTEPAGLNLANACPTYTGSDQCVACVLAHCCDQARACYGDKSSSCTCLEAEQTPGVTWPKDHPCGAPDSAYSAFETCQADNDCPCPAKASTGAAGEADGAGGP